MSPEEILDVEALLQPISEEAPSGVYVRPLGVYDEVKALRTTESADSMVGTLRAGEYKTAQWGKVISVSVKELGSRTKDLQLGVWLTEALVRQHGFAGLARGLEFILGLNTRFWPTYYPAIEDGGLDIRAGRFSELERVISQAIDATPMTAKVDGESHAFWEWKQVQILLQNASRAQANERDSILSEANGKKEIIEKAIAKSSWEFYDDVLQPLIQSQDILTQLREAIDKLFADDPGYRDMEDGITGFSELRKDLDACRLRVEGILDEKPAPPGKGRNAPVAQAAEDGGGETSGTAAKGSIGGSGGLSVEPQSRADALQRLGLIAQFFQRTEPHSPVSYLVQRAVRWGEMPLESWLDEVISDTSILNTLRETLGLPKKDGY